MRLTETQVEWLVGFMVISTAIMFAALAPVLAYWDILP